MLFKCCTVQVNAREHTHDDELIMDTGSSVSIIPESMYRTLFPIVLLTYSRQKVPVKGCMHATITYNGHITTGSFVVVKSGTALLELDLFLALHMCIKVYTVVTATSPTDLNVQCASTIPSTSPQLHQRLGCWRWDVQKDLCTKYNLNWMLSQYNRN